MPIFSKITKYQAHVAKHPRMAELLARCFDMAMSERGPTQFNIPRDNFYGEADYEILAPKRILRGPGADESLEEAAELLASAKFPVIVSGGGVVMSGGMREAVALAEQLQAPVVNSYLHNDSFPSDHPLWTGPLGYQGSKAAMKSPRALMSSSRSAQGSDRSAHPAAAWPRLLAEGGQDHPGRQRPSHARAGQADFGRNRRRCEGGGRGAFLPARQPPPPI